MPTPLQDSAAAAVNPTAHIVFLVQCFHVIRERIYSDMGEGVFDLCANVLNVWFLVVTDIYILGQSAERVSCRILMEFGLSLSNGICFRILMEFGVRLASSIVKVTLLRFRCSPYTASCDDF